MKSNIAKAALSALFFCGTVMAGGHLAASTTDTQNVYWFDDATETGGKSHLTRTDGMILVSLEASALEAGNAHTLWFVVFNNPDGCSAPGCGEDDLNPDGIMAAQISVSNASGNVAKSDGTLEFGARLSPNANTPGHQVVFGAGFESDFALTVSPHAAEVHLIVQTHGQGRGGKSLREQLSMVNANCTPACADIQFSVHLP